jgi:hypothetical protein
LKRRSLIKCRFLHPSTTNQSFGLVFVAASVADPGCLFQIPDPNFFHPGSRVKKIPGSAFTSKNSSILTQKIVSKLSEISSKMFIPNPDLDFLPIPDPEYATMVAAGSEMARLKLKGWTYDLPMDE